MTIHTKSGLRRVVSLAAFTALIAAVTMAFADTPQRRTQVTLTHGEAALSTTPAPAVRLAEAPVQKKKAKAPVAKSTLSGTLNLNTATAIELTKLPGIGPKKAELIVQWRKKHGSFGRVVDLRRVKGFGAKSVKKLRPYLTVSGKSSLR
jgi:comEA protein